MAGVVRLEHVGIGASRQKYEETVRFYQRAFGWHVVREVPGTLAFVGDGSGGRLEILPDDAPPLARPHHLAFVVAQSEFDSQMVALRQAGAEVEAPTTNVSGDRLCFFTDPAGNRAQIVARNEALAV